MGSADNLPKVALCVTCDEKLTLGRHRSGWRHRKATIRSPSRLLASLNFAQAAELTGMSSTSRWSRCFATSALALLLAGCGPGMLHVIGDEQAIGETVEIDGNKVAELSGGVYRGSTSTDPIVMERERGMQQRSSIRPGDKFASTQVFVSNGVHDLRVTGRNGQTLAKRFTMQGENYIPSEFY
jgi:hypothetical protein